MPDFSHGTVRHHADAAAHVDGAQYLVRSLAVHYRYVLWQFATVPTIARNNTKGPIFVFVHILAPHPPIVFDAKGNLVRQNPHVAVKAGRHWRNIREERTEYCHKYREEVIYLNKRTLEMVDGILAASRRPTVIILQGDHGPWILPNHDSDKNISVYETLLDF